MNGRITNVFTDRAEDEIGAAVATAKSAGTLFCDLSTGDPDFDTPPHITRAAVEALQGGETHYGPVQGLPALRGALADDISSQWDTKVDPTRELLVTTGGRMGLYLACQVLLDPGDRVIIVEPYYPAFPTMVRLAGAEPVFVPARHENGRFVPDVGLLARALDKRTRCIILNTPNNPTGTVYGEHELSGIVQFAVRNDLYIISDEVYDHYLFDRRQHISPAWFGADVRHKTIVVSSFSKTYAMTGWRIGYTVANATITRLMTRLQHSSTRAAATFVQRAGLAATTGDRGWFSRILAAYEDRRRLAQSLIQRVPGVDLAVSEGGLYVFFDVSSYRLSAKDLVLACIRRHGVVLSAGHAYGSGSATWVRMALTAEHATLTEACRRVLHALTEEGGTRVPARSDTQ